MEWEKLQLYSCTARLARYLQESQGDKHQAIQCYILNIKLSESFGFWTILFNIKYEVLLWKSLRLAFPYCPKMLCKRKTISSSLNKIRRLSMIRQSKSEIS